jgi:hypothetical protein
MHTLRTCFSSIEFGNSLTDYQMTEALKINAGVFDVRCALCELELEQIQTQMTQKPVLRSEVYARALRASQNRKEDIV